METRKFKVIAKTSKIKGNIQLRVGNGGMMTGGASKVIDLNTGTSSCDLVEGQEIQGLQGDRIIDPICLACFWRGLICQASA